jgi:flagella basal body P-ring formation protein FlgA
MLRLIFQFCLFSWIFAVILPLSASERQSLTSIQLQAENFLSLYDWPSPYPPEFTLHTLDSRLKLEPCATGLDIQFRDRNKKHGQTSLEISGPHPVSWRIYLPVRIDLFDNALVTRKPVLRGQALTPDLFKLRKVRISDQARGYFSDPKQLERMQSAKILKTGTVLNPAHLTAQNIVERGQRVTLMVDIQGLTVKTTGKAMQSASVGDVIKVRNLHSERIVEGRVTADGDVRVGL